MGGRVKRALGAALASLLIATTPASAATYFVTVGGHVGEPDYEQRFTSAARDLDKVLKAAGPDARVTTLTGAEATRERRVDRRVSTLRPCGDLRDEERH